MSTNLRIEVRTGDAERKQVDFTPGEPAEPFSVGSAASWVVKGDGVVDVHAYLYFDGATLFVASVGGAPVTMAGRSVGADWEPVDVPMNIHVGGAKLAVRGPTSHRTGEATQPREQVPVPEEDEKTHFKPVPNTVRQGPRGAAVESAPAAPAAPSEGFEAPPDSEATVVQQPGAQVLRAARPSVPPIKPPPESETTRIAPVEARPGPAAGAPGMGPGAAPPGAHPPLALAQEQLPTTRRAPLPAAGAPPPGGRMPGAPMPGAPMPGRPMPGGPMPGAPMPGGPMPGGPMPGAPMPGGSVPGAPMPGAPMPGAPMQPGAPHMPGPPPPGYAAQPGQVPVPGAAPGGTPPRPAGEQSTAQKLKAQVAKAWGEASVPQKAILVLLPFAFIAMFSLMGGEPEKKPAAPAGSAASIKSAAAAGSAAAGSAAPAAASAPGPAASAPPAVASGAAKAAATAKAKAKAKAPTKGKSRERLAVDAVAAGNYQEALKQYQALAAAHPDQAVYQKAIRILKQKMAQQ